MGVAGFEPAKAVPPDLQSGPFDRSGTPPFPECRMSKSECRKSDSTPLYYMGDICWAVCFWTRLDRDRFEGRCCHGVGRMAGTPGKASGGTRTHNHRFTKPGLCQLSYASRVRVFKRNDYDSNAFDACKADFFAVLTVSRHSRQSTQARSAAEKTVQAPALDHMPVRRAPINLIDSRSR